MNLILKSGHILTKNKKGWIIKPNISIVIKDGYINKINNKNIFLKNYKIIDCQNKIIIPGLCNAHLHLGDTIFRGIINNVKIDNYIKQTEVYNKNFDDFGRRKISAQFTLLDSIRNGITSCCVGRGWPLFKGINFYNMNILTGYVLMDIKRLRNDYNDFEEKFFKYKREIKKFCPDLKIGIFIHSIGLINKNLFKKIKQIIDAEKIKLIIHIGETPKKTKKTDLEILNKYGLISKYTILVHCTNLSENDYKLIKRFKPNIVLCPSSNLKLLSGVADFRKLLDTGCNICIATDGGATNNSFSLFGEARLASLLYSYFARKFIFNENKLLDLIITNPLNMLGFRKTGLIKKGYRADLITIDKNFIGIQPQRSFINNLIFSGDPGMIKEVIIKGQPIITGGRFRDKVRSKKIISLFNKLCNEL